MAVCEKCRRVLGGGNQYICGSCGATVCGDHVYPDGMLLYSKIDFEDGKPIPYEGTRKGCAVCLDQQLQRHHRLRSELWRRRWSGRLESFVGMIVFILVVSAVAYAIRNGC